MAALLAGCVATPGPAPIQGPVAPFASEDQRFLRTVAAEMASEYEAEGWSAGESAAAAARRLTGRLLTGESAAPAALSPSAAYLARRAPDDAEPETVAEALDADMLRALVLAVRVSTAGRTVARAEHPMTADELARDIAAVETAINQLGRAIALFTRARNSVAGRLSPDQIAALELRHASLADEFARLGAAADALAERRREARRAVLG